MKFHQHRFSVFLPGLLAFVGACSEAPDSVPRHSSGYASSSSSGGDAGAGGMTGGGGMAGSSGTAGSGGAAGSGGSMMAVVPKPDFGLVDTNPNTSTFGQTISPRDYTGQVSAWYFGHST